jgi:hypothetical protein
MKDSSEMQFYLNKVIDTKELIDFSQMYLP